MDLLELLGDLGVVKALTLSLRPERFILFCDDLSFEEGDDAYKALKGALDGELAQRADNVLIYATSNHRHLLPDRMADNTATQRIDDEIHPGEAVEEESLPVRALWPVVISILSTRMPIWQQSASGCGTSG